ncbi:MULTISPECIES: succinylglutamate desuccinylase/aspartoacylase family protein [unclassified Chelatococcus]|uniref:M14 family metallopeptidase n=1 Tax=unclassified Chelatococcus TaxID=2638111 RepID=UPI001BD021FB|nr:MULTISPECIES: succinylglutamate desuccinylase/aspartoacylase family protein [unclassified Chelatococcus]CAH1648321.1 Succinylglutamate desuccinylase/aspartoacylase [Hyphomicrobiales bacterium]MBS7741991.1 succinylglutamate desuccinylase/aspartoacylase family protein [Chelatococcus sp. HY11]MBX3541211.1 succinylglutamate desuccinylase/aspartoacylase family protein [Chelatococcus sp.]MCO5074896.1 succinylglutamate desuccinylase/aspartoacylase family protein [Chelatococcus sp.]CAH1690764.1 Suc
MSNRPDERLDRRDFMIASIAAVGTSAALAASAGSAQAQAPAATPVSPTSGAPLATVYTGDTIQGKRVVSTLDVNDLEPGKKHLLYFQGVEMPTGQHWYVSVTVAKGARPGKRVVLVSGVHGDEMSSIHTVQTVMNQLDPAQMSGTVMAVTDVSRPALESMQRRWPNFGRGNDLIDMNREWPGNENGASAPSRHAGLLFNRLLRPNADAAIDFHTGTTGFDVTAFNIGGMDVPEIRAMLELYPVGQIFDNHVYPGVLHNAFVDEGIPAFTPEIGAARVLNPAMISLFVEGTMNVLKHHGIVAGPMGRTAKDVNVFIGNSALPVLATEGGLVEYLVKLDDKVAAGQKLAIQRNSFGEVVAEYTTSVAGAITGLRSDAMAEPGNPLAFILFQKPTPDDSENYPE